MPRGEGLAKKKRVAGVGTQARRDVEKAQKDVANAHKSESRLQARTASSKQVPGLRG